MSGIAILPPVADAKASGLSLPLAGPGGSLEAFGPRLAGDVALHQTLCAWRQANMAAFFTSFVATPETTGNYLHFSARTANRILFLVRDINRVPVGNIGLCNITPQEAELDNVLRGGSACPPGLMRAAATALLGWAFAVLDVGRVYLNVLDDNARAIAFYTALGMKKEITRPLWRQDTSDGYQLVPNPGEGRAPYSAGMLTMTLSRVDLVSAE